MPWTEPTLQRPVTSLHTSWILATQRPCSPLARLRPGHHVGIDAAGCGYFALNAGGRWFDSNRRATGVAQWLERRMDRIRLLLDPAMVPFTDVPEMKPNPPSWR